MQELNFNVQIFPLAVAKIIKHSAQNPRTEIAGLLVGHIIDNNTIIITDVKSGKQKGTSVHVFIDDIEMVRIAEELESSNLNEKIVGWYHSHPNMGAHFFSIIDTNTQSKYQMFLSQAVGFVVDPSKFIQTGNFSDIDLKCWRVIDHKAVNIDYRIITDSTKCLINLISHSKLEFDIFGNLVPIFQKILPQLELTFDVPIQISTSSQEKVIEIPNDRVVLNVSTQIIIIITFLVLTISFIFNM